MSHKNRLYVFTVVLTIIGVIFNLGSVRVSAAPLNLATADPITTLALLETPTPKPPLDTPTPKLPLATPTPKPPLDTPSMQMGAEPEAWLDGAIDPEQFGPTQSLTIHFNTPLSPESSPHPILSWPSVDGISSWDSTQTILTFKPSSILNSKKTYTFFLDTALRSTDGKALKNPAEWIIHVQSGPKIQGISPQPGSLDQRFKVIEVHFDRSMKPAVSQGKVITLCKSSWVSLWNLTNVMISL
jgi:hypothetical protein